VHDLKENAKTSIIPKTMLDLDVHLDNGKTDLRGGAHTQPQDKPSSRDKHTKKKSHAKLEQKAMSDDLSSDSRDSSGGSSGDSSGDSVDGSVSSRQTSKLVKFGRALKQTLYLGTWSNVVVPVVATLIIVFISLLALRPPMVMVEKKSKDPNEKPQMVLSAGLALVWAIIAAIIVLVITFFSRPKAPTSYSQVS
jgi:hypothetical protein